MLSAGCWVHSRRGFFDALGAEPQVAGGALRQIAALYDIEEQIRSAKLRAGKRAAAIMSHSAPINGHDPSRT